MLVFYHYFIENVQLVQFQGIYWKKSETSSDRGVRVSECSEHKEDWNPQKYPTYRWLGNMTQS